jgi:hypothetical protein
MVVHAYNSSTQEKKEDHKFKTNLGYITTPYLKKKKNSKGKGERGSYWG